MNMQKALQHLYKAVSGEDTSKVNISKLLVDIHQALTGKDSANRNNWARIIDSMAENWSGSGGGGGSSDFSTAQVTIIADSNDPTTGELALPNVFDDGEIHPVLTINAYTATRTVVLYQNLLQIYDDNENPIIKSTTGAIELVDEEGTYAITGDCSITVKQFSFS